MTTTKSIQEKLASLSAEHPIQLSDSSVQRYAFDDKSIQALQFAFAAKRPLLLRGEAGTGKTELARAVARHCDVPLLTQVMASTSTAKDLLWQVDYVQRIAASQTLSPNLTKEERESTLALNRFLEHGVFVEAIKLESAVVLIDEIDKASFEVPNDLLDVLDGKGYIGPDGKRVNTEGKFNNVLTVITCNDDKPLPEPFLRRCAVHTLVFESTPEWLVSKAIAHFCKNTPSQDEAELFRFAADEFLRLRETIKLGYKPGTSEYLDLLRAVQELVPISPESQEKRKSLIRDFSQFIKK